MPGRDKSRVVFISTREHFTNDLISADWDCSVAISHSLKYRIAYFLKYFLKKNLFEEWI
jgi:hypothetical protein